MLKIITDSSSDYTLLEAQNLNIEVLPLTFTIDDKTYKDGIDITKEEFYNMLIKDKKYPKTSQPTPEVFVKIFEEAKKNNDTLLVILIASSLSGTYSNCMIAKEQVGYENIFVVDSCTTIGGLQILVETAIHMASSGTNVVDIVKKLDVLKKKIVVIGCINTLEYLVKGGRINGFEARIGDFLNLKPIIQFDEFGAVKMIGKTFGNTRANIQILKLFRSLPADENYPIYYYYSYNPENLNTMVAKLKKENLYREGKYVNLSPVVGCHIGDNAYALVYIRKD